MKTMSISLQESLYERLKHFVPAKKISSFVSAAIIKELNSKEEQLSLAYQAVEKDQDRQALLNEWNLIDDFN